MAQMKEERSIESGERRKTLSSVLRLPFSVFRPQYLFRWAALGCLLVGGWVHGDWSGRWNSREALVKAVARVERVPMIVGNWQAKTLETDETEFAQARAQSYWMRTYTHTRSKASLQVILMCGRAGHMSVHTPEICYQGAGFEMAGSPEVWSVEEGRRTKDEGQGTEKNPLYDLRFPPSLPRPSSFWTAQFRKQSGLSGQLRLFWGWNARGEWQACAIRAGKRWESRFSTRCMFRTNRYRPTRTWPRSSCVTSCRA